MIRRLGWSALSAGILLLALQHRTAAQKTPLNQHDILPIVTRCFQCHGESLKMSGLDLRSRAAMLKGGAGGPAIVPGNASASLLIKRVTGEVKPMMPMAPVPALTQQEIATLKEWIDQGAKGDGDSAPAPAPTASAYGSGYKEKQFTDEDRKWWAFQKPVRNAAPKVAEDRFSHNPIDGFVRDMMEKKGLTPAPQADRRTLIRRAYLDLWGLLPPVEEVEKFVNDPAPDAYEKLIDRLLDSPHYGERWGRFWLDVAGYAESDGYNELDKPRPFAWKYRDYVIRSFNADKPFDQFITEQLAGDEMVKPLYEDLSSADQDRLIATGFLRMGPDGTDSGDANPKLAQNEAVAGAIRIVSTSLLGLTVGCAQCHDHRYDPIPQLDYYRFRAVLEPAYDWKNWRQPS